MKAEWGMLPVLFAYGVLLLAGCGDGEKISQPLESCTPPSLSVTIVDLSGPYDGVAKRQGDALCDVPCAIPFGEVLSPGQLNVAYEIITTPTAQVRASTAGIVEVVETNPAPQTDSEIRIRVEPGSPWQVIYDHVNFVTVGMGDSVAPGTVLGTAGDWDQNHGRVELQINDDSVRLSVCPEPLGTVEFNDAHLDWLAAHNLVTGATVYGTVCLTDTVVP